MGFKTVRCIHSNSTSCLKQKLHLMHIAVETEMDSVMYTAASLPVQTYRCEVVVAS